MDDGRKEKRIPKHSEALLSNAEQPLCSEMAAMENASSHGARLRTERPWEPDSLISVKFAQSDWAHARVVYCHKLPGKSFAVGIELRKQTTHPGELPGAAGSRPTTAFQIERSSRQGFTSATTTKPRCQSCASVNLAELRGEISLHLPGLSGLNEDPILLFPKVAVCLDCGLLQARLSPGERQQIRRGGSKLDPPSA